MKPWQAIGLRRAFWFSRAILMKKLINQLSYSCFEGWIVHVGGTS